MIKANFTLNQSQYKPVQLNGQKTGCKTAISFGGKIPVDMSKLHPADRLNICRDLQQNTWFFRNGLIESLDAIMNEFSGKLHPLLPHGKPVNFYVYGCSEGHETYSIILYLLKKYGSIENAKKRVKIHSIDIPSPGLEMAKSRKLSLELDDLNRLFELGFNHNSISNNRRTSYIDYIDPKEGNIKIKIKDGVFKYANFQEGRILDDFSPNGKFNEKEPVVVFFRNAFPYINPEKAMQFIDDLHAKLPEGSFFCVGAYDHHPEVKEQFKKLNDTFKPYKKFSYITYNGKPYLFKKTENYRHPIDRVKEMGSKAIQTLLKWLSF